MKHLLIFSLAIFFTIHSSGQEWNEVESGSEEQLRRVHFINENTGFIVGNNGTLLISTDGGNSWDVADTGVSHFLNTITFANENVGYVNGLKTIDGGQTWTPQPITINFGIMYAFDENKLIAGDINFSGNLYISNDGGITWEEHSNPILASGLPSGAFNDICFVNEEIGYLSAWYAGNLFKTIDGGTSWTHLEIENVDGESWSSDDFLSVDFPSNDVGVFSHENGVLKTNDAGITWSEILATDIPPSLYVTKVIALDENTFIAAGGIIGDTSSQAKLLESTDGGLTWTSSIQTNDYFWDLTCTDSKCFAVGNDGVIYSRLNDLINSNQELLESEISIYPNPSTDIIQIETEYYLLDYIEIKDLNGKMCIPKIISPNQIDISHLEPGIYLLQLKSEDSSTSYKIVKN
ncbi:MAG: YCF48-related protein [Bacteroidota bacterium]